MNAWALMGGQDKNLSVCSTANDQFLASNGSGVALTARELPLQLYGRLTQR
jgi:hypothetical protein